MSYWQSVDPFKPWTVPNRPGVSVIYFNGIPGYVGQSNNMRGRFSTHKIQHTYARFIRTPWHTFSDDVEITAKVKVSRRLGDWAMWEIRLIQRLKPGFNQKLLSKSRDAA